MDLTLPLVGPVASGALVAKVAEEAEAAAGLEHRTLGSRVTGFRAPGEDREVGAAEAQAAARTPVCVMVRSGTRRRQAGVAVVVVRVVVRARVVRVAPEEQQARPGTLPRPEQTRLPAAQALRRARRPTTLSIRGQQAEVKFWSSQGVTRDLIHLEQRGRT